MIRSLIAAYAVENGAIGPEGTLPWHLPDDLARFRQLTMRHTVIHGRRTHQSLEGRRLDGRRVIVLSETLQRTPENAHAVAPSLERALQIAADEYQESEAFISGGGSVYKEALDRNLIDRMYLTLVEASIEADTFFPSYDPDRWEVVFAEHHPRDDRHAYSFTFQTLERRDNRSDAD